jgi:hypothetical protein
MADKKETVVVTSDKEVAKGVCRSEFLQLVRAAKTSQAMQSNRAVANALGLSIPPAITFPRTSKNSAVYSEPAFPDNATDREPATSTEVLPMIAEPPCLT